MSNYRLISEPNAPDSEQQIVRDGVDEFNMVTTNDRNYSPVNIFVRDKQGGIAGGILGDYWGGWLHVNYLWVADKVRQHGYGAQLLRAAEDEARKKGCRGSLLETFSFQAPDFYRRYGYQGAGEVRDYPRGHTHFILWKSLV
jgi:GNAT superfamily N-acetyltransferase